MLIFALLAARSISIFETPAWYRRFFRKLRTLMSSWRRSAYSRCANQRESQLSVIAEAETLRMDLLTHAYASTPFRRSSTTTVMWLVRLKTFVARPCARGRNRLSVGPSSTNARLT